MGACVWTEGGVDPGLTCAQAQMQEETWPAVRPPGGLPPSTIPLKILGPVMSTPVVRGELPFSPSALLARCGGAWWWRSSRTMRAKSDRARLAPGDECLSIEGVAAEGVAAEGVTGPAEEGMADEDVTGPAAVILD